jgi:hypothetical protein
MILSAFVDIWEMIERRLRNMMYGPPESWFTESLEALWKPH